MDTVRNFSGRAEPLARRIICLMGRRKSATSGTVPIRVMRHDARTALGIFDCLPWRMAMSGDQEFLFYPLDTGEDPACLTCGTLMVIAAHEVRETKPDFITFRCKN